MNQVKIKPFDKRLNTKLSISVKCIFLNVSIILHLVVSKTPNNFLSDHLRDTLGIFLG